MAKNNRRKGEGYLYKSPQGVYYAEFKINGKRTRRSLKTTRLVEAEKALREMAKTFQMRDQHDLVREVAKAKKIVEDIKPIALEDSWDYHMNSGINEITKRSAETRKCAWNSFIRYMADKHLVGFIHDLTEAHLVDYFNHRAKEIAKSTYDGQKVNIRHILATCKAETALLDAPIWERRVKEDDARPKRMGFSPKEAKQIMETISCDEMRDIFILGFYVGMRAVDACPLTWDKINLKFKTVKYTPSKTKESSGKTMTIPLLKPVYDMLVRRKLEATDMQYVFPEMRRLYQDCANGRFQVEVRKALKAIDIEPQQEYNGRKYSIKLPLLPLHGSLNVF